MVAKRSIRATIYAILGLIFLVVFISGGTIILSLQKADPDADIIDALGRQRMLSQAMGKSILGYDADRRKFKTLRNKAISLDQYVTHMRAVYTQYIIGVIKKTDIDISMTPKDDAHLALPYPATFTRLVNNRFAKQVAETGGDISVDIIATKPINPDKGLVTEIDRRATEFLYENRDEVYFEPSEENGLFYLVFYTVDRATVEACVSCHNSFNADANYKIGDVLGFRKYKVLFNDDISAGKAELEPSIDEYEAAKAMFSQTLSAMKYGGKFPTDMQLSKYADVDKIEDETIQKKIDEVSGKFKQLTETATSLTSAGESAYTGKLRRRIIAQSNELRKLSNDVVHLFTNRARGNQRNIEIAVHTSGVFVLLIIIVAVYLFNREVIVPIKSLTETIGFIDSSSDLNQRIEIRSHNNEIGKAGLAFNKMLDKFQSIIGNMAESAEHLAVATTELSATTLENAGQAKTQQGMVSEVAFTVERINSAISDIAKNANRVTKTSLETKRQAAESGEVIDRSGKAISELSDQSKKIGGILDVIEDIAKKTDLLAINAAIEAANAGHQGHGFAVVADEVRKLAERTTLATNEISGIIQKIQVYTDDVVQSMKLSSDAMSKIIVDTTKVDKMVEQIASSAENQANFVNAAVGSVRIIKELSEGFSNASDQTQTVAESISSQSNYLQDVVDQFNIGNKHHDHTDAFDSAFNMDDD